MCCTTLTVRAKSSNISELSGLENLLETGAWQSAWSWRVAAAPSTHSARGTAASGQRYVSRASNDPSHLRHYEDDMLVCFNSGISDVTVGCQCRGIKGWEVSIDFKSCLLVWGCPYITYAHFGVSEHPWWCCKRLVSICPNPWYKHIDDIIYEQP